MSQVKIKGKNVRLVGWGTQTRATTECLRDSANLQSSLRCHPSREGICPAALVGSEPTRKVPRSGLRSVTPGERVGARRARPATEPGRRGGGRRRPPERPDLSLLPGPKRAGSLTGVAPHAPRGEERENSFLVSRGSVSDQSLSVCTPPLTARIPFRPFLVRSPLVPGVSLRGHDALTWPERADCTEPKWVRRLAGAAEPGAPSLPAPPATDPPRIAPPRPGSSRPAPPRSGLRRPRSQGGRRQVPTALPRFWDRWLEWARGAFRLSQPSRSPGEIAKAFPCVPGRHSLGSGFLLPQNRPARVRTSLAWGDPRQCHL